MLSAVALLGLADKIGRVKNARARIVQGHGVRFRVLAVSELRGLADKIDRVKNAWTRIVQGSSD